MSCMPAGLPWRVDAGYVCMQQAPNYGTHYTPPEPSMSEIRPAAGDPAHT